jgi:hypothetical protein
MSGIVGFLNYGLKKLRLQSLQRIGSALVVGGKPTKNALCGYEDALRQKFYGF